LEAVIVVSVLLSLVQAIVTGDTTLPSQTTTAHHTTDEKSKEGSDSPDAVHSLHESDTTVDRAALAKKLRLQVGRVPCHALGPSELMPF